MAPLVFDHPQLECHELLDSGRAEKLERFGDVVLRRPDPQALWERSAAKREWERAHLTFERESDRGGRWRGGAALPNSVRRVGGGDYEWSVDALGARVAIRPTPFKHVGMFPEQAGNWRLLENLAPDFGHARPKLLNLFGYTGVASVIAARAGYDVTHVDASKTSVAWARANAEASGVDLSSNMRLIVDDATAFARREVRRERRYDVILLDPPHYGRGPKGERWQLETGLAPLIDTCRRLLAERALLVLSVYAVGTSPLALANVVRSIEHDALESRELALPERGGARLLPTGFCARLGRGVRVV